MLCLAGFTVASVLCGLAGGLGSLVVFRILQAVPGGIIPVTCMIMLRRMVPPERLGAAMGLYGLGVIVAPAIGPSLGGLLVEYTDWRFIFFINVPVGILGVIGAAIVLKKDRATATARWTSWASPPSPPGCSRCCWRWRRARTGAGRATRS